MDWFDLMSSEHFLVILHPDKRHGLIFNRLDDTVSTINHDDAKELCNLKADGRCYGIVGKYLNKYLVVIKNRALVGTLYEPNSRTEHKVYVILQVQVIDISCSSTKEQSKSNSVRYDAAAMLKNESDLVKEKVQLQDNPVDPNDFSSLPITISTSSYNSMQSRAGWNPFRLANSFKPKMPTQFLRSSNNDSSTDEIGSSGSAQTSNMVEESDKRLIEEMIKLFNNTNSFYFSPTLDLTNRFSRKIPIKESGNESIWKTAEEKFFWNRYMLKDLIELSEKDIEANYFISIILQGFIAIENHSVFTPKSLNNESSLIMTTSCNSNCDKEAEVPKDGNQMQTLSLRRNHHLALISRRSVFHAGTRYRRRGCDERGECANFVETEQIFRYNQHFNSMVIIRGSIPLFWYQTGFNYRPPPVLHRSEEENSTAFKSHYTGLLKAYDTEQIINVDCTEQSGRERALHDSFKKHVDNSKPSSGSIKHIEFDFHKLCRGRQCSHIQVERHLKACGLTEQLLKEVRYYWNDGDIVWKQNGIFRVNCLDCSDRTNVVQRAIALQVLDMQLARLGIISPDTSYDDNECRKIMHLMWSTNGNVLSTQYCGTRALFSEDAKISGILKDTYSSASRYYIGKFRDAYRQAAIDAMLGVESSERIFDSSCQKEPSSTLDHYELLSLEPILAGKNVGGAILKDVGSRVSNRLARLKGRFNVRPSVSVANVLYGVDVDTVEETDPEISEAIIAESIGDMSIDWPSSESVAISEQLKQSQEQQPSVFAQFTPGEECFQDDEFGQLMLSIDLAELQRLRGNDDELKENSKTQQAESTTVEEITMTESRGLKSGSSENISTNKTSTTST